MAKKNQQQAPKSFEDAIAELENIQQGMERENVHLEESLAQYERGTFLIAWCRSVLGEAEKKIVELGKTDAGQLSGKPVDSSEQG
jgi:exodeoxyribonuclease VII small subunit